MQWSKSQSVLRGQVQDHRGWSIGLVRRRRSMRAGRLNRGSKGRGRTLFSPITSCVDLCRVIEALLEDVRSLGIRVGTGSRYVGSMKDSILTTTGDVTTGFVVNAAGLYIDRVAKDFGFAQIGPPSDLPVGPARSKLQSLAQLKHPLRAFQRLAFIVVATCAHVRPGTIICPTPSRSLLSGALQTRSKACVSGCATR